MLIGGYNRGFGIIQDYNLGVIYCNLQNAYSFDVATTRPYKQVIMTASQRAGPQAFNSMLVVTIQSFLKAMRGRGGPGV